MNVIRCKALTLRCSRFVLLPLLFLFFILFFTSSSTQKLFSNKPNVVLDRSAPTYNTKLFPKIQHSLHQYPAFTPLLSVLTQWNPNNPSPPRGFSESLQHFNFSDPAERALAEVYRKAELPFKVYDVPIFNNVSRMWSKQYLSENFKNMK